MKQDLANLIRGLLKAFGILVGKLGAGRFDARVRELADDRPLLLAALDPLLTIRLRVLGRSSRWTGTSSARPRRTRPAVG